MRHVDQIIACAVLCFVGAGAAHATVLYNWQTTGAGNRAQGVDGTLRVADTAFESGSVNFDSRTVPVNPDGSVDSPLSRSGLIFNYTLPGEDTSSSGPIPASVDPTSPSFAGGNSGDLLVAALIFNDDGTLTGSFDIGTESDNFSSMGTGLSWIVSEVTSDYFAEDGCNVDPACTGGTGYWLLDKSTAPGTTTVPTASIWSLYGLATVAIFGLAGFRSRKRGRLSCASA